MNALKCILILLFCASNVSIGHGQATREENLYTGEFERAPSVEPHFAEKLRSAGHEQQEQFRPRIAIQHAVGDDVLMAAAPQHKSETLPAQSPDVWLNDSRTLALAFLTVVLTLVFLSRKFLIDLLKALNAGFNPWMTASRATEFPTRVRAEEQGLADFLAALKAGPSVNDAGLGDSAMRSKLVRTFCEKMTTKLGNLRQMARELRRTSDAGARQKILEALRWELHSIRAESSVPELLHVWQLAFAMEGLLKQLTENAANVTPSTLRTLKGSLELLGDISRPEVEPALRSQKPLRLLAVDDDPIGRKAVSCALERVLNEPELAADCETTLSLTAAKTYDVIFLDVQLPEMDGFELCSRIHETAVNRNTPIVFVTSHSDFETRAKSTLVGSSDLIGKPFLTFEITVKALTVVLRDRLRAFAEDPIVVANPLIPAADSVDDVRSSHAFLEQASEEENIEARQIANLFLADTSERLLPLREAFQDLLRATDSAARRDLLGDIFVYVHSFIRQDELPTTHPALQLRSAIEGLLRKLLEKSTNAADSTFSTLVTGVQVMDELCHSGPTAHRLVDSPFRILVVDDDPVARAGISGALQMMSINSDEAESGERALAQAGRQSYDVILVDAQMPVMDGFEVYGKLRQSTTNTCTPVIFVVNGDDAKSRARVVASGASDSIEKPFLNPEIILKALTFALLGRLKRIAGNQIAEPIGSTSDAPMREEMSPTA